MNSKEQTQQHQQLIDLICSDKDQQTCSLFLALMLENQLAN